VTRAEIGKAMTPEPITLTVMIDRPADHVWAAVMSPQGWWPGFTLDPRTGGSWTEVWSNDQGREVTTSGRVLELQPPSRLRLSWRDEDWPGETEVTITIQPVDDAEVPVIVAVEHAGWDSLGAAAVPVRDAHVAGWQHHLSELGRYCLGTQP